MQLIVFAVLAVVSGLLAWSAADAPISRNAVEKFHARQLVDITPFNGGHLIAELRAARRLSWPGVALGIAVCLSAIAVGQFRVEAYFPLAGWLGGMMLARLRPRPRFRKPLGLHLAPPMLVGVWRLSAVLSCGLALSAVVRSFWLEVPVGPRLWAAGTLGLVLAVHLLVRDLLTRPLALGTADLVSAEVALRARTARALLGAGATVALWTAVRAEVPGAPAVDVAGFLVSYGVPIAAWISAVRPWRAGYAAERPDRRWATAGGVVLATAALSVCWMVWGPNVPADPRVRITGFRADIGGEPVRYAHLGSRMARWELFREPGQGYPLPEAATTLGIRPAPFAISGDGHHLAFVDESSRRLVHLDIASGRRSELTDPLRPGSTLEPAFSHDGRHLTLTTADGVDLVDVRTGTTTRLPGIARVIGVGADAVVATTEGRAVRGSFDTTLVVLDHRGVVRTRAPFDPTLDVRLAPDGRSLAVLTSDEIVTMDVATGKVTGRHDLDLPSRGWDTSVMGWDGGQRLLVRIDPVDSDKEHAYVVNPSTGRAKPFKGVPDEGHVVGGSVS